MTIIKSATKQYAVQMEDLGYEEGVLQKWLRNIDKTQDEAIVRNQCQAF